MWSKGDLTDRTPTWVWCALVFAVAFVWMLMSGAILDDHFTRITRGWQIWVYGERPFIDFRDPGYYLTLYTSAAMQALSGGSLLGEAVLDWAAIALAVALTFLLVVEVSQSPAVGLLAVVLALGVAPRYYDYDKGLFYGLGLMSCWRYIDRRSVALVVAAGLLTTVAELFRYDNGLIVAAAFLVTLVACHDRDRRVLAGMRSFGVPDAGLDTYRVLIRASAIPDHTESRWNLPCLVARRSDRLSAGWPGTQNN